MKFTKVSSEYRMVSDEGNYELSVLSRGREDDHHFRLASPLNELEFDALLEYEPSPEWHVYSITLYARESAKAQEKELKGSNNLAIFRLIEQALSDFGYFYGLEAGRFGIRFVTDKVHCPN